MRLKYHFNLPPESDVILRNRTITTYYAQLYQREPSLYKWAGMAAFASFHIGEKLKIWDWEATPIKTLSETCKKKNKSLEDDFQIIRIINNKIFSEIGTALLTFSQMEYQVFRNQLILERKNELIIAAFDKLQEARIKMQNDTVDQETYDLVWEANLQILWHEQYKVVQPLFDKLSLVFSGAMSIIASFDYRIHHKQTNWRLASRFILFMFSKGFKVLLHNGILPDVTNIKHRWFWISSDLFVKWKSAESNKQLITEEMQILSSLELRKLDILTHIHQKNT
ncbi:hypothetical protein GCM10009430_22500 [Aquimarina litoralis]|uniref:Uncharacterized protein n=1 Tax=Aquimarina litoralis TaxID=584605 RepID=A0ABN1IU05_9FLAO